MSNERPKILLKTDSKTIMLELGREGKFSAKARGCGAGVVNRGEQIEIGVENGHWRPLSNRRPCCSPCFSGLAGRRVGKCDAQPGM
jgi:hypothetical protein